MGQSQPRSWQPLLPPATFRAGGTEGIEGSSASGLSFPVKIASNPTPGALLGERV